MIYLFYILLTLAVFFAMELVAWATHKYVMHGFLWKLHEDHHRPHDHFLEHNDWFSVFFAIPSILCFFLWSRYGNPWLLCVGLGILLYGIAYFLVHDVIIHQRVKWFTRSKNKYVRQLRWAHKMHHKHLGPDNGESFGFLFVERKYREKIKRDEEHARGTATK